MSRVFSPATEADFERLLDLRLRVMREHLERAGRYDPERARALLRRRFSPSTMRLIHVAGSFAGCVNVVPHADHVEIGLFYLEPAFQGRGIGRAVLDAVIAEQPGMPHRLEVLKGSPAVRFYERANFRRTGETAWDVQFERPGVRRGATSPTGALLAAGAPDLPPGAAGE